MKVIINNIRNGKPGTNDIIRNIFKDYEVIDLINDFESIRTLNDSVFIISNDMIPCVDNALEYFKDIDDYDVVWFNKFKDQCEYHTKINDKLKTTLGGNSIHAIYISSKVLPIVDFNNINSICLNYKTAVTTNNVFTLNLNYANKVNDFERMIECDYPYKKNKLYNNDYKAIILAIMIITITLFIIYLLIVINRV